MTTSTGDIPLIHSTTHFNDIGGCTAALEVSALHTQHPFHL